MLWMCPNIFMTCHEILLKFIHYLLLCHSIRLVVAIALMDTFFFDQATAIIDEPSIPQVTVVWAAIMVATALTSSATCGAV